MLKVALTHDVDRIVRTYQVVSKPLNAIIRRDFRSFLKSAKVAFEKDSYWRFEDILDIEQSFGVKSTFYFLNESIKFDFQNPKTFVLAKGRYSILDNRVKDMIKYLDSNGWEIGVHGSYNSYDDLDLLVKEKKVLEEILGHSVIGIRQHHLNLNTKTWLYQKEAGFKYDTSFGYNREIGFKDEQYLPFKPFSDEFIVFPQVIMDFCFINDINKWENLERILDDCEREGAILILNWHNSVFNDGDFPGYKDAYIKIIERCQKRNAVFKPLQNYYLELDPE